MIRLAIAAFVAAFFVSSAVACQTQEDVLADFGNKGLEFPIDRHELNGHPDIWFWFFEDGRAFLFTETEEGCVADVAPLRPFIASKLRAQLMSW